MDADYKNIPDIRTIFWETVLVSTVLCIPDIRTYMTIPKSVLITDISYKRRKLLFMRIIIVS